jgi:hypothetical protein
VSALVPLCGLANYDANAARTARASDSTSGSTSATPTPTPTPSPEAFSLSPNVGKQGRDYDVLVTDEKCPSDSSKSTISGSVLIAPLGSGVVISDSKVTDCHLSAKLSIAGDAPVAVVKLKLRNDTREFILDFAVTGITQGPIPPGLNGQGQVDVMWSILPDKIVKDNFGGKVKKEFFCIEAVIGNDSGYDLQLSSVGFTIPKLTGVTRAPIPTTGYRTVRGTLEAWGQLSTRKFVLGGLNALGPILTGFLPFFHATNHKANYSEIVNLISNPIEKGVEGLWPDMLPMELDHLADQAFRDDISTKTIIPNNVQARIVTFVPKRLVFASKKNDAHKDPTPREVMEALAEIVIIGKQIDYVNRVRVVNTPFGTSITDHTISGKVTDACGGIPNVEMKLTASGFQDRIVTTNADGSYSFPNVPDGRTYTVMATLGKAMFKTTSDTFVLNDTKNNLDFSTRSYVIQGTVKLPANQTVPPDVKAVVKGKHDDAGFGTQEGPVKTDGTFLVIVPWTGAAPDLTINLQLPSGTTFKEPDSIDWSCSKREPTFALQPKSSPSPTPTPSPTS